MSGPAILAVPRQECRRPQLRAAAAPSAHREKAEERHGVREGSRRPSDRAANAVPNEDNREVNREEKQQVPRAAQLVRRKPDHKGGHRCDQKQSCRRVQRATHPGARLTVGVFKEHPPRRRSAGELVRADARC